MAFGFFKKTVNADLVLHNGKVLTLNTDTPEVSAVACKGDKIIATGNYEDIEHLISGDTEIIDLKGKFLVPGFISLFDKPVMGAFKDMFADISSCRTSSELAEVMTQWAVTHPEADVCFGYGFDDSIFDGIAENNPEEIISLLDSCCQDKPLVILAKNNITCLLNSCGIDIVKQTAEEEMVEYITAPYILNLLIPFDFEQLECNVQKQIDKNLKYGITSVLNLDSPEYFETFYQDVLVGIYNEDSLHQRFFGSYYMNRPVITGGLVHHLMNRKNTCIELDDFVHANILYVDLNQAKCPVDFTQDMLNNIAEATADKGFDIIIKASDVEDLEMAYFALEHIREKGYKVIFAIESQHFATEAFLNELMFSESVLLLNNFCSYAPAAEAAEVIGMSSKIGSIETGKYADMAIFNDNPYETEDPLEAVMTVFNGKIA